MKYRIAVTVLAIAALSPAAYILLGGCATAPTRMTTLETQTSSDPLTGKTWLTTNPVILTDAEGKWLEKPLVQVSLSQLEEAGQGCGVWFSVSDDAWIFVESLEIVLDGGQPVIVEPITEVDRDVGVGGISETAIFGCDLAKRIASSKTARLRFRGKERITDVRVISAEQIGGFRGFLSDIGVEPGGGAGEAVALAEDERSESASAARVEAEGDSAVVEADTVAPAAPEKTWLKVSRDDLTGEETWSTSLLPLHTPSDASRSGAKVYVSLMEMPEKIRGDLPCAMAFYYIAEDWAFLGKLELVVDGGAVESLEPATEPTRDHNGGVTSEMLLYRCDLARRIADSQSVRFRLKGEKASTVRVFAASDIQVFKLFLAALAERRSGGDGAGVEASPPAAVDPAADDR